MYVCIVYIYILYVCIRNEEEKKCRIEENEYMKKRVNTFFNERFKLFKIINSTFLFIDFVARFLTCECWKSICL